MVQHLGLYSTVLRTEEVLLDEQAQLPQRNPSTFQLASTKLLPVAIENCTFETIQLPCENERLQGSRNCFSTEGKFSLSPNNDQCQSEPALRDEGAVISFFHLCPSGSEEESRSAAAARRSTELRFYLGIPLKQPDQQSLSQDGVEGWGGGQSAVTSDLCRRGQSGRNALVQSRLVTAAREPRGSSFSHLMTIQSFCFWSGAFA